MMVVSRQSKTRELEQTESKETTETTASFTQTKSSLYKNVLKSSDSDQSCKDGLQHDQHEN